MDLQTNLFSIEKLPLLQEMIKQSALTAHEMLKELQYNDSASARLDLDTIQQIIQRYTQELSNGQSIKKQLALILNHEDFVSAREQITAIIAQVDDLEILNKKVITLTRSIERAAIDNILTMGDTEAAFLLLSGNKKNTN